MSAVPNHPARAKALSLLTNLPCQQPFHELESRISGLSNTKEMGDAFEVFIQAYFACVYEKTPLEMWCAPFPEWLTKLLNITIADNGIDGIIKLGDEEYLAYQAKFRSAREDKLYWGKDSLSNFAGLLGDSLFGLVATNASGIDDVTATRKNIGCIAGAALDLLTGDDFSRMLEWLDTGIINKVIPVPRPHQIEALNNIYRGFHENDRITVVMPCGTGKSFTARWAYEQAVSSLATKASSCLVLVPSLALMAQMRKSFDLAGVPVMSVCSDKSVSNDDDLSAQASEVDFPVTTNKDEIRSWLERTAETRRIVFCTYQSIKVLAEGMPEGLFFDFSVLDEAHKTSGHKEKQFGYALDDRNIYLKKRLFMTATPKHYKLSAHAGLSDPLEVYSMDDPEIYGPVAHELSFKTAVEQDIICGYRVIVSVVTSEMVEAYRKRASIYIEGESYSADEIAKHLAVAGVFEKYPVTKAFLFHSTTHDAERFAQNAPPNIYSSTPDLRTFHVNGKMKVAGRQQRFHEFNSSEKALMTNARCLTEGVDVPDVDLVAFMSPKRSMVDITQAIGRALRKAGPTKKLGYVLVPLFIEQVENESIEDALARTEYTAIAEVLNSLLEQDDTLLDVIGDIQHDLATGRISSTSRSREIFEVIGPVANLEILQKSIVLKCVERLGCPWDRRFSELKAYAESSGEVEVPKTMPALRAWAKSQAQQWRKGTLSEEKISQLISIGFQMGASVSKADQWAARYAELVEFFKNKGHTRIPKQAGGLGSWVATQRAAKRAGQLKPDREALLTTLSFEWSLLNPEGTDEENLEALAKFKIKYGHTDVLQQKGEYFELGAWCGQLRVRYDEKTNSSYGPVSQKTIEALDALGFVWTKRRELKWADFIRRAKEFFLLYPSGATPSKGTYDEQKFDNLFFYRLARARTNYADGKLSEERISDLTNIGFVWENKATTPPHQKAITYLTNYVEERLNAINPFILINSANEDSSKVGAIRWLRRNLQALPSLKDQFPAEVFAAISQVADINNISFKGIELSLKLKKLHDLFVVGEAYLPITSWETILAALEWRRSQKKITIEITIPARPALENWRAGADQISETLGNEVLPSKYLTRWLSDQAAFAEAGELTPIQVAIIREIQGKILDIQARVATFSESTNQALAESTETAIDGFYLSVRALNCLNRANITTVEELCTKTESELLCLPNFGVTTLALIKSYLASINKRLANH